MPRPLTIAALFSLLCPVTAITPGVASAESPSAEAQAALVSAQLGYQHFKKGEFDKALAEFQRAESFGEACADRPTVFWMIARSLESLGRPLEAAAGFDRAIAGERDPARLEKYRAHLAEFETRSFGTVAVRCVPVGAQVRIGADGATQACPTSRTRILPGELAVSPILGGRAFPATTLKVVAGSAQSVELTVPGAIAVDAGELNGAAFVDGRAAGWLPVSEVLVSPGAHTVEIRSGDAVVWRETPTVLAGQSVRLIASHTQPRAEPPAGGGNALGWALTGAGGLLLVGGAGMWAIAAGEYADADAARRRYEAATEPAGAARARKQVEDHNDTGDRERIVTFSLVGAGAAVLGVGLWRLLRNDAEPADTPGAALFVAPGGGAAVTFSGGF